MANTVTYTVDGSSVAFQYPILTITETPILAGRQDFTIAVRKVFTVRGIIVVDEGETLDNKIRFYHEILSAPGGTLTINYGDWSEELTINNAKDLRDGPHPSALDITKIYGGKAAVVTWQIETERFPTDTAYTGHEGRWVDLVYTIRTSLDENFYATRTISGILRLNRTNSAVIERSADTFRKTIAAYFKLPPKKQGLWQRVSQQFESSEDNTTLSFTLTDRQVYSWLPDKVSAGDMSVTTSVQKHGKGEFEIRGWFESYEWNSRGLVHTAILSILNLFYQQVILNVYAGSSNKWYLREESASFTHHWRSNRIEFVDRWSTFGIPAKGGAIDVVGNIEFMTSIVVNWLAYLSRTVSKEPPNLTTSSYTYINPYGTSGVAGHTGTEEIAPIINIDFEKKIAKSKIFRSEVGGGGTRVSRTSTRASELTLVFHQSFAYKIDYGIRDIPVLSAGYNSIFQQVKNPEIFLTIVGEKITSEEPSSAPLPPYQLLDADYVGGEVAGNIPTNRAVLLSANIKPVSPTPTGEYKLAWQYVLKLVGVTIPPNFEAGITLRWPYSERLTRTWATDANRSWLNFSPI